MLTNTTHAVTSKSVSFNLSRANECKNGDWSNKCYRCGEGGHLKKDCKKSRTPPRKRGGRRSRDRERNRRHDQRDYDRRDK